MAEGVLKDRKKKRQNVSMINFCITFVSEKQKRLASGERKTKDKNNH